MLSDPAAAAWVAAGRPPVEAAKPVPGRCGRCGEDGATVASSRIVSWKFTGFDAWPFGTRRLCVPCAWAYSQPPNEQTAQLITATAVTTFATGAELTPMLTAGPLPPTHAALVPDACRRHILPTTEWGHLATDEMAIAWDGLAARRLTDLVWLRSKIGATWPQLGDPVPPARLLTRHPTDQWSTILRAWASLQPWRELPPLWSVSQILTVPLSAEQVRAGRRLGELIRTARAERDPESVARDAGISPKTLRKIEIGSPSPRFGAVVDLCTALNLPLQDAVDAWRGPDADRVAI